MATFDSETITFDSMSITFDDAGLQDAAPPAAPPPTPAPRLHRSFRTLDQMMPDIDAEIISRIGVCCLINDRPVRGIWFDEYTDDAFGIDATAPGFHCRSMDVDWVRANDMLTKGDAMYRIVGTPVDSGITKLRLVILTPRTL